MRRLAAELGVAPMAPYRYVSGKDDLLELMVDHVYADLRLPSGLAWRESLRTLAVRTRELMLQHRWLAQLSPQAKLSLTPNRMAVAEQALAALDGLDLDADTMMSVFRAVDAYVHGAMSYESAVSTVISEQSLSGGDELRDELAPLMMWHMRTGRYPTFQHYLRTATRKDDTSVAVRLRPGLPPRRHRHPPGHQQPATPLRHDRDRPLGLDCDATAASSVSAVIILPRSGQWRPNSPTSPTGVRNRGHT